jgi:hypothetical protein
MSKLPRPESDRGPYAPGTRIPAECDSQDVPLRVVTQSSLRLNAAQTWPVRDPAVLLSLVHDARHVGANIPELDVDVLWKLRGTD